MRPNGEEWVRREGTLGIGRWPEQAVGGAVGGHGEKNVDMVGQRAAG